MKHDIRPVRFHRVTDGDVAEFLYWSDVDLASADAFGVYMINDTGESRWLHDADSILDAYQWLGQRFSGLGQQYRHRYGVYSLRLASAEIADACALSVLALEA